MSRSQIDRRAFLSIGARAGVSACGLCVLSQLLPTASANETSGKNEPIDPAGLNYCGYTCPPDCKMREATLAGDIQLKQEAFDAWKLKDRYGVDFDPDQTICYGCKAEGKPEGTVVSRCTVRACVQERKLDCCIECDALATCDKELWKLFPTFRDKVVEMQQQYRAQS